MPRSRGTETEGSGRCDALEGAAQGRSDLIRDRLNLRVLQDLHGGVGVHGANHGVAVLDRNGDVAGQQDADLGHCLQCPVGRRRVAGPEYEIGLHVDTELLFEFRLDVDLGEHPEPFRGELLSAPSNGLVERQLSHDLERDASGADSLSVFVVHGDMSITNSRRAPSPPPQALLAYGMRYPFHTVDVFTDHPFGGNPLAVLPDATGLSPAQMQAVAREFNYSETTFVLPPERAGCDRRVRIFTPAAELPFAGHPTVGTAFVLALLGEFTPGQGEVRDIAFEEGAGQVPVRLRWKDGLPRGAELTAPQPFRETTEELEARALSECLELDEGDLLVGDGDPAVISCGLPFLLVRIGSLAAIQRAHLRMDAWQKHLSGREAARMLYLYCAQATGEGVDAHVRLFAPAQGVAEDPATGSAATALGGYLAAHRAETTGTFRWTLEQGLEIGRPSRLQVAADKKDGVVTAVRCGGACVAISEGTISMPG